MHLQLYFGSSELSPGGNRRPYMSAWGSSIPLTLLGAVWCVGTICFSLTPYFLLAGQPHLCMLQCFTISTLSLDQTVLSVVLQHFVCSPLFLGGRAPHEHTVAPHYLRTFSGQGSSAGRYCSVLLAPQLFRQGCPLCAQPSGNTK